MSPINFFLKPIRWIRSRKIRIERYIRLEYYRFSGIKIGKKCFISTGAYIDTHRLGFIEIGDNCTITQGCKIICHSEAKQGGSLKLWGDTEYGKVKIGNNVFIGVDTVILPNVTIGDNVIIGAKSLITSRSVIPSNTLFAGIPAKKLHDLDEVIDFTRIKKQK